MAHPPGAASRCRAVALLAIASVMAFAGCDKFYGYTVWVANTTGEDRIVVLGGPGGLAAGPTYLVPGDGLVRQTEFVMTGSESVADRISREVYVFDGSCKLLGSLGIDTVGGYELTLTPDAEPQLELLPESAEPTAAAMTPADASGCSPVPEP